MSYATSSDIAIYMPAEALLRLGSDDPGATAPDSTIIAMALEQAASLIDAALRAAGIAVPLAEPPPIIKELALSLARCWLYRRRPEGMAMPDALKDACQASDRMLAAIASGAIKLGHTSAGPQEIRLGTRTRDWGMLA
jgi:phage gp36-like protein